MWDYSNKVYDHFRHPKNVGEIENPDAFADVGNITCGDALYLTLKINKETKVITGRQIQNIRMRQRYCLVIGSYRTDHRQNNR